MAHSALVPPHPDIKYFPTGKTRLRPHTLEDGTILLVCQIELGSNMTSALKYRDATIEDISVDIPLTKN